MRAEIGHRYTVWNELLRVHERGQVTFIRPVEEGGELRLWVWTDTGRHIWVKMAHVISEVP